MRSAERRIKAYEARMQSSLLDPQRAATRSLAVANYTAYANEWVTMQNKVRQELNDAGLDSAKFFLYEAFSAEMYRGFKKTSGDSYVAVATNLVAKYVAQGATEALCIAIAENVFNVTVPPAGP